MDHTSFAGDPVAPQTPAHLHSTYTEVGTIQGNFAWPLGKEGIQIREVFQVFKLYDSTYRTYLEWSSPLTQEDGG